MLSSVSIATAKGLSRKAEARWATAENVNGRLEVHIGTPAAMFSLKDVTCMNMLHKDMPALDSDVLVINKDVLELFKDIDAIRVKSIPSSESDGFRASEQKFKQFFSQSGSQWFKFNELWLLFT